MSQDLTSAHAAFLEDRFRAMPPTDYVRCRACDRRRIKDGSTIDLCVPCNRPADLDCPCGGIRESYDCQNQRFDEDPA